jgi:hypothetical protein
MCNFTYYGAQQAHTINMIRKITNGIFLAINFNFLKNFWGGEKTPLLLKSILVKSLG